jgi:hypothetical protein
MLNIKMTIEEIKKKIKEECIIRAYKIDPETREEFLVWSAYAVDAPHVWRAIKIFGMENDPDESIS